MAKVVPRDVGPFLAKVRDLLIGRKHMNNLRFPVRIYRLFSFYQSTFFKVGYTHSPADLRFQDKGFFYLTFTDFQRNRQKMPTSDFQKVNIQCREPSEDFFRGMFYVIDII